MTTDTITIPAEIRGTIHGVLQTAKERATAAQEYADAVAIRTLMDAIPKPPRYIYPTPVEACRMIADAGGPIECEDEDGQPIRLIAVDLIDDCLPFKVEGRNTATGFRFSDWFSRIRVLQPE